ncbi:MAG: hypothetical protein HFJ51_07490 [Clostridia bacterium]|nr:hypothetical protein [Clostridia bacterium]
MRDTDIDIAELIINKMPQDTELQQRIRTYIQAHKSNCNEYLYSKYSRETTFFNTILKSLQVDLGAEVARVLTDKGII